MRGAGGSECWVRYDVSSFMVYLPYSAIKHGGATRPCLLPAVLYVTVHRPSAATYPVTLRAGDARATSGAFHTSCWPDTKYPVRFLNVEPVAVIRRAFNKYLEQRAKYPLPCTTRNIIYS